MNEAVRRHQRVLRELLPFLAARYHVASLGLFAKLGFVEEGRRRRAEFLGGRYHDEILLGVTVEEFAAVYGLPEAGGTQFTVAAADFIGSRISWAEMNHSSARRKASSSPQRQQVG